MSHTTNRGASSTSEETRAERRNEDPITGAPGSHADGVGIGAASGGATGMAIGSVGGPVGMAVGAVAGAIVGGLVGKGVGEYVDPTEDDDYLASNFNSRPYVQKGETFESYKPVYQYGGQAQANYPGRSFDEIETDLRTDWEVNHAATTGKAWDQARDAVRDGFDRTIQLREERLHATTTPVQTGEVNVRKEVHTENRTIEVPVEREEVVIERRPVTQRTGAAPIVGEAETLRIPVKEEQVHVSKDTIVREEVSVGKKTVKDTEKVSAAVRKEKLDVDTTGDVTTRERSS
jgi:uncharacterized protein (TIGR02271 family)